MDKIEVWIAALPKSLTYEELRDIIREKSGPVDIIGAQFKHLRSNLSYAFVQVGSFRDARAMIQALDRKNMFGDECLTVKMARSNKESKKNFHSKDRRRGMPERSIVRRGESRNETSYLDRISSRIGGISDVLNERWSHISESDSTSTSRVPIPSRPEIFQPSRLSPPTPTCSPSQSNFQLSSDSIDHSILIDVFQSPPRFSHSREDLDLWIEYSWHGRLPFDYAIRKQTGYFDNVTKVMPPNWRIIPCTKFPPVLGQKNFCWGRLCNFAHGPFELRITHNSLKYPEMTDHSAWTTSTFASLQEEKPIIPKRSASPLLTDRYALIKQSKTLENDSTRSLREQEKRNDDDDDDDDDDDYGLEISTKRQKLTRTWSKIDNIDPFEFEEFALPIITPPFSSFKRSATSNITLGYLSSPQASFALSVIQPCSEKTNFNKQYESFLKSSLDPQDREFYFEGFNIIEDYSERNLDFMDLANKMVEKEEKKKDKRRSSRR